jgi:prepilin-type N-terminal cleavage/methylation domain-containing protein
MHPSRAERKQLGFTLVELAVVVVIIGVLASFAVPRFISSVERTKAGEAFNYLATIHGSQERYAVRQGTYASDLDDLDVILDDPRYFSVGAVEFAPGLSDLEGGWMLSMTRSGFAVGYGEYTVTWTHEGFEPDESTIPDEINPLPTRGS